MLNKTTLIAALTVVGTFLATAQVFAADLLITGAYSAQGRNPDGTAYQGFARILQNGALVNFEWTIAGETFRGQGAIEGRVVTIDWNSQHPVVYVVMPDGALHGTWADGLALDKLTPQ